MSEIQESDLRDEYSFELFDPTLTIELRGRNAFEAFGFRDAGNVIVMDFLTKTLRETLHILQQLDWKIEEADHEFYLTGSPRAWRVTLRRQGTNLEVALAEDDTSPQVVGQISVRDWVEGVLAFAREIFDLYQRLNPQALSRLRGERHDAQRLEDSIASR